MFSFFNFELSLNNILDIGKKQKYVSTRSSSGGIDVWKVGGNCISIKEYKDKVKIKYSNGRLKVFPSHQIIEIRNWI